MNYRIQFATLGLLPCILNSISLSALAQGSLTPPGPPAPTMLTLNQIEPRTPITTVPYTISLPGSYYLATNFTVSSGNAIIIATNDVFLDLRGFTLNCGAPGGGYGILFDGAQRNLTIVNGFIDGGVTNTPAAFNGPGFQAGISYIGGNPDNVRVSGVSVAGCQFSGIYLMTLDSTLVESCHVRSVGGYGIQAATIRGCVAADCGSAGLVGNTISDSQGTCIFSGPGIQAYNAQNCSGSSSSGYGLYAGSVAINCVGNSTSGTGLYVAGPADNCSGVSTGGIGLEAVTANNCFGVSITSIGLFAKATASTCFGSSSNNIGLSALIANVCHGVSTTGTPINSGHNINSF